MTCGSSKLGPRELVGGFKRLGIACLYGDADRRGADARLQRTPDPYRCCWKSDCRPRAQLNSSPLPSPSGSAVLDLVLALVAQWRDSLIIVQPLRWRRESWSAFWRYRSRGRWRGQDPRVSDEVRHLIVRMARENSLGCAADQGELLILGLEVSQATV